MSQIVLYFLRSTSVRSFHIDVVLILSFSIRWHRWIPFTTGPASNTENNSVPWCFMRRQNVGMIIELPCSRFHSPPFTVASFKLGMVIQIHPTLYDWCNYSSIPGLKLIHVSKVHKFNWNMEHCDENEWITSNEMTGIWLRLRSMHGLELITWKKITGQSSERLALVETVRYLQHVKSLRVAHAPGMPGTFSPPPTSKEIASYRSRHASRHVPWYMSGSITRGGGENFPGIPGACATRNYAYLARAPLPLA